MNKKSLIDILKLYKEKKIIEQIKYKKLDINDLDDQKILEDILLLDKTKECFGDYNLNWCHYTNFAVFLDNKLIGYFSYFNSQYEITSQLMFAICLSKEYQNIGIGNIIIKQAINTVFTNMVNINSIYVTILSTNEKSKKLFEKNHFSKFSGYREYDYFLINGEEKLQEHYIYTKDDYKNDKKTYSKYKTFKLV